METNAVNQDREEQKMDLFLVEKMQQLQVRPIMSVMSGVSQNVPICFRCWRDL